MTQVLPKPMQAPPKATCIRVFLAEDHDITLWGLHRLIDSAQPGMRVVGTARTRESLLADPAIADADVVLLDLDLSGEDGSGAIADLRQRCAASCLVLTGADDLQRHRQALLRLGCHLIQGHGIAHPMPAARMQRWMRAYATRH